MTRREILLRKIGTYKFALKDLGLYLNTHPTDRVAIEKFNEYKRVLTPLVAEFEREFGPLVSRREIDKSYSWIKNPWPWDIEEDD